MSFFGFFGPSVSRSNQPEYLLLLDGLNEVPSAEIKGIKVPELIRCEIGDLLECPNVRVILTSRSDDECDTAFDKLIRFYLSGIGRDSIKEFLEYKKVSVERIEREVIE